MLGIFLLILIRVSYMLEWEIMTGRVIFAELRVERENVTGYELTVWGTNKEERSEIEKNTAHFWRWLDNISMDKVMYYMVRKPKVRLKSTVKIKHWYSKKVEIYEENGFVEEREGNGTVKYFIGSTYRTSINEEIGGCWILRTWKNFNSWKMGQCKVRGSKRGKEKEKIVSAGKIKKSIEDWIKAGKIINPEGEFVLLTPARDRVVGSRRTDYAEMEVRSETWIDLKLNQTYPWIWRKIMALPSVKFNSEIGYWEIDNTKWETDMYLAKMELNKMLKTERDIKGHCENNMKLLDKCVRKELSKRRHGKKYFYTKK